MGYVVGLGSYKIKIRTKCTKKSHAFIGMWHQDFVIRRDLKQ